MLSSSIYQIKTPNGHSYIGSTVTFPKQRWHVHRSNAKRGNNAKLYKQMREEGIDNCKFEVLEQGDWNKDELVNKEDEWLNKLNPDLNTYQKAANKGAYPVITLKEILQRIQK